MTRLAYVCLAFVACLLVLRPTQVLAQGPGGGTPPCPCQNRIDWHDGWWCKVSGTCGGWIQDDDFYKRLVEKHDCGYICIQCSAWLWQECCVEWDPEPDCDW